jgi:hypothetical protein
MIVISLKFAKIAHIFMSIRPDTISDPIILKVPHPTGPESKLGYEAT